MFHLVVFWKELLEQRQIRQQQKQEMSKRRSVASHKRMKIISQLAEEVTTGKYMVWLGHLLLNAL